MRQQQKSGPAGVLEWIWNMDLYGFSGILSRVREHSVPTKQIGFRLEVPVYHFVTSVRYMLQQTLPMPFTFSSPMT